MKEIAHTVLSESFMVAGFVMVMMLLIEYVNVVSRGSWSATLKESPFKQLLLATALGLMPGCLGGFVIVSMFTHGVVNFGALVACLVASMGDEAFVLMSMDPSASLLVFAILGVAGLATGWITNLVSPHIKIPFDGSHWTIHHEDHKGHDSVLGHIPDNIRHLTLLRGLMLGGILTFIVAVLWGWLDHGHESHADEGTSMETVITWIFTGAAVLALVLALWVQEHFLRHHWWQHIIRGHFPKIFLWTFGIILLLTIAGHYTDLSLWIRSNPLQVLGLAILIGLIPQSGPHILFVTLFAQGHIALSILLANSIVQEGHAGLPLLAESKSGFFRMKAISAIVGIFVGLLGYFLEF